MFGMGLFEIILIAVIAIIALGPEKLPTAMIEVARFFKKFKSGLDEAKSTIDNELQLSDMKEEASKFKAQIESVKSTAKFDDINIDNILEEKDEKSQKKVILEDSENAVNENPFKANQVKIEELNIDDETSTKDSK